jgi:hypothetical protein
MLKNNLFGDLGQWASDISASVSCIEYKSSRCRRICEGNVPVCQCEAVLSDLFFTKKGDWLVDLFR